MRLGASDPKPVPISPANNSAVPAPKIPKPVPAVPVQPVTPVQPPAPIAANPDPIFGSGQKPDSAPAQPISTTGIPEANDLFSSHEQPAPNPFDTAYAPPAPIQRPQQPRRRRRVSGQKSVAGPTMSIISGVMGLFYGLFCIIIYAIAVVSLIGDSGAERLPEADRIFRIVSRSILLLFSLAISGSCGHSAVTGIMELTSNKRNPKPSQTAGAVCIAYTGTLILMTVIAIFIAFSMQANVGQVQYDGTDVAAMIIGILIVFVLQLLFLLVPIFVFCVGHFRNR